MQHSPGFLKISQEAKAAVEETDVPSVAKRLRGGEKLKLIDVREESEFAAGHLPGARHIGKGVIERDIEKAIPDPASEIILYCGGGYRSALAAENLKRMGYTKVISMDGGYRSWTEAGLDIER